MSSDDRDPTTDMAAPTQLRLRYAAVSDVGRHRKENQDSGYASPTLLVVADGVGGAAYGDVASSTAVHLLRRLDTQQSPDAAAAEEEDQLPALAGAIHRVHDKLAEMVEQDGELEGTSTTVTAALLDGPRLAVAHIGDSRAYLLRDGEVSQVTKDHTFVQTLIDEGRITEADSRVHPHRNIILRAVDGVHDTDPDLFHLDLRPGDRVMLCSDGCSGVLDLADIGRLMGLETVDAAAVALVQDSLDAGSTDNVTVVVAEVVDDLAAGASDVDESSAAAAVGPMLVGAAADQPRRGGMLSRALFRHRHGDTGEIEPVASQPVDPEELRYAPLAPRRRAWPRRTFFVLLPLLVLAAVLYGAYAWSQNQYYVAPDGENVAIYQGVQLDLPGVRLSEPYEVDSLKLDHLPPFEQQKVESGIVADDLTDARDIVTNLAEQVNYCEEPTPAEKKERERRQSKADSGSGSGSGGGGSDGSGTGGTDGGSDSSANGSGSDGTGSGDTGSGDGGEADCVERPEDGTTS